MSMVAEPVPFAEVPEKLNNKAQLFAAKAKTIIPANNVRFMNCLHRWKCAYEIKP